MFNCPHCWDNPCSCGHDYENMAPERRLNTAAGALGVTKEVMLRMMEPYKHLPELQKYYPDKK